MVVSIGHSTAGVTFEGVHVKPEVCQERERAQLGRYLACANMSSEEI